jgi:hypothetical protein
MVSAEHRFFLSGTFHQPIFLPIFIKRIKYGGIIDQGELMRHRAGKPVGQKVKQQ